MVDALELIPQALYPLLAKKMNIGEDITMHDNKPSNVIDIVASLRKVAVLKQLDDATLMKVAELCTVRDIERGEQLLAEGETADEFFIAIHGRFIVFSGKTAIAEIAPGEPIGEMAFFSGEPRSASVFAARRSQVLVLTRQIYDVLVRNVPELPSSIIRALAHRITAANTRSSTLYPRAGSIIGVFPASNDRLNPKFIAELSQVFSRIPNWHIIHESDLRDGQTLFDWIMTQEAAEQSLVLVCASTTQQSDWARQISEASEINVVVVETSSGTANESFVSELEQHIYRSSLRTNTHVVLLRQSGQSSAKNSAQWLSDRHAGLHHHVALDTKADFERLARFMTGEAVGLVFCGGGAFGTAHLGMVKALSEHGYTFDMVGGTSIGAAMAGAFAMGISPDEVMDICDDMFLRSRSMKRLTAPVHSIIEHRYFDEQLKKHYKDYDIADLPLNFYAIATSLTHNDISVRRQGPLWQAVRASTAIPGVFPPMLGQDGEVLIDGALIDNAPLETMRTLKPGANIVMNFARTPEWRIKSNYDHVPGRMGALRKMVFGNGVRFPSMFAVLNRSMIVNAERKIATTDPGKDVIFEMQPLKGMAFLDWTKGRRQFEHAYQKMSSVLEVSKPDSAQSNMTALQVAAKQISNGRASSWGRKKS